MKESNRKIKFIPFLLHIKGHHYRREWLVPKLFGSKFDRKAGCCRFWQTMALQANAWSRIKIEHRHHQESLRFIPWSRFFRTISIAWLGKAWQGGSQYLVLQSKESTKVDERREDFLCLITSPEAADTSSTSTCCSLIFACTSYPTG